MSDSQDSGGGQNHDKRFLTAPFNWDSSSNFTSTLDIDAIKVSHSTDTDMVSPMVGTDQWDQGPPVLIPHVATDDDRSAPRLEPMDQQSSSESDSDDDCSDSDSGSSSSSCSSPESGSSSDAEVETSQVT